MAGEQSSPAVQKPNQSVMRLISVVRQVVRELRSAPALVAAVVVTLAAGGGTLIAAFELVDATLQRPLPYAHGDRLVELFTSNARTGVHGPKLDRSLVGELSRATDVFQAVTAYQFEAATITGPGPAALVGAARVDASLLSTLSAPPPWTAMRPR